MPIITDGKVQGEWTYLTRLYKLNSPEGSDYRDITYFPESPEDMQNLLDEKNGDIIFPLIFASFDNLELVGEGERPWWGNILEKMNMILTWEDLYLIRNSRINAFLPTSIASLLDTVDSTDDVGLFTFQIGFDES